MGRGLDGFDPSALCDLRLRRGMTQDELAEASGVLQPNICALERGRQRPSVKTAHALAVALGVPPERLFTHPPANPLVRLRIHGGLTQREAAHLAGVPYSSYAVLELAGALVPAEVVARLAAAVGLSPDGLALAGPGRQAGGAEGPARSSPAERPQGPAGQASAEGRPRSGAKRA